MIKTAYNKAYIGTLDITITAIQALCQDKPYTSYDELRATIPALAGLPDNEVQQCIQDAGYKEYAVEDDFSFPLIKDKPVPE